MSAAIVALVIGTLLAIAALAFVLYPLFFDPRPPHGVAPRSTGGFDRSPATRPPGFGLRQPSGAVASSCEKTDSWPASGFDRWIVRR